MRIKRIEIEGFKSYSTREVVDNLDPQFNAITGLNGSGKSNILDAICFLLGITNLANVRAHSLADLVFKQGQAGITRATVTIVFDNDVPPEQQPAGYSKSKEIVVRRQIIISGRNTYQINGTAATNQRVSDLFRMVGMNVNNPHFLIMQGRITKVLNMKPMEILSMLEEAAGVRMYECKKQSAIKTIEKKESKVEEISRLIEEEILPRVEQLKKDRANYLEFQRIERELEELERKLFAYDFFNSELQVREHTKKIEKIRQDLQQLTNKIEEFQDEIRSEQANLQKMEQETAKQTGPELKKLESTLKQLQNEEAKIESERDEKEANIAELETEIGRKQKSLENDQKELERKRKQLAETEGETGSEEQRGRAAEEAVVRARQKLEALARGMTTDEEGNAITLEAQLTATRTKLSEQQTAVKRAEMRLGQLQKMLERKKGELQKMARRSLGDEQMKKQLENEIAQIEAELNSLNFDADSQKRLEDEQRKLMREMAKEMSEIEKQEERHYHLQSNYKDPHVGFNRNKVKGVVAKLFKLRDPKFATALEVAGGGRIYNIVVDTAGTAQTLLDKKCFQHRVTMLPLDKIEARLLTQQQIQEAKKCVGEGNVFLPSELLEYAPEMEPVIAYVFGGSLICMNMEQARLLTYENKRVNCRTVTLNGDDFNPRGVLTGGSRNPTSSVLRTLHDVAGRYEQVTKIDQQMKNVGAQLTAIKQTRRRYDELKSRLIECKKRLDAVNDALKMNPVEVLRTEIEQMEQEINEANEALETGRPEIVALEKRVEKLEQQKKDDNFQETEKKKAEKELANAQKDLERLKGTFANAKETLETLREEIASLENSIEEDRQEIDQMINSKEEKRAEIKRFQTKVTEANEKLKAAQQELDNYNKEIRQHDKATRAKMAEIEDLKKKVRQSENKQQSLEKDAQEAAKTLKEFAKRAKKLEELHKWIAEEKDSFGNPDTLYDFRNYTFDVGKREIETRRDRRNALLQTVNPRAMKLLDTAEQQYHELEAKHAQLEKDKKQLYETIEQLDEKKRRELIAAHKQISQDFCAIYSTLLPGASAELVPPSGAENCLSGLEVRVAFNGKYKDSLAELSGGQRSLVALSLVLAMLKFKPAPFYILDEIDAALDMSHTENIGKMIKNHFGQSQFIVVSLKQGFFDNANVVYRVQFKEGRSMVTRTENRR